MCLMRRGSKHTVEAGNVVVKLKSTIWAEGISKQANQAPRDLLLSCVVASDELALVFLELRGLHTNYICD